MEHDELDIEAMLSIDIDAGRRKGEELSPDALRALVEQAQIHVDSLECVHAEEAEW